MCLFSFPSDTSTPRRKNSSSSSYSFRSNKHKPQGPITREKGLRQSPPPPPPPTSEPTPKDPRLSPRREKRGNVPVSLGATNCARRRYSGSPARSSGGARSSSRARSSSGGDKHGGSNRTSREKKETKREPDMGPWKEDDGGIEECMWRMHLQNHDYKGDQAKAQQPQPHARLPSWLPGSDALYPSSASDVSHKGASSWTRDFQHESQSRNTVDYYRPKVFIQQEEHVWTWLKGSEGTYILVVITQLGMGGFDLS